MNNRRKRKLTYILLALCMITGGLFTGCVGKDDPESVDIDRELKQKDKITDIVKPDKPVIIGKQDEKETPSEASGIVGQLIDEVLSKESQIEDFSKIDHYLKDYTFDISYDSNLEFYERTYTVSGSYDLNGDQIKDKISAVLVSNYVDRSFIEVNGVPLDLGEINPSGEVKVCDIDSRDVYVELAVYDDGPSGDPTIMFYRYDGTELLPLATVHQHALMDGKGKFISWFHLSNYFTPQFFSAWEELKDDNMVLVNHDVTPYIGKEYELSGTGFFVPMDQMVENYKEYVDWDFESMREFESEKIKLLDIYVSEEDRTLNWFYVELESGERGFLYFWIGD